VREILASLGFKRLHDVVGKTSLLKQLHHIHGLELNALLQEPVADKDFVAGSQPYNPLPETLDALMLKDAAPFLERREKMQLSYAVRNIHRSVGAGLASAITRRYGMQSLPDHHLTIRLSGSAGQSLGAFTVGGMTTEVVGDANDFVGKGLSGGTIIIRPPTKSAHLRGQTILGNTALYGATRGLLLAAGQAGDRFAVRNSGARAVVEGVGENALEYMTGGVVVILGAFGHNMAAGMTGGMAFVWDPKQVLPYYLNAGSVGLYTPDPEQIRELLDLLTKHHQYTHSAVSGALLQEWPNALPEMRMIIPNEMMALRKKAA
jgi:glutamate synthase (NADPH) large chain